MPSVPPLASSAVRNSPGDHQRLAATFFSLPFPAYILKASHSTSQKHPIQLPKIFFPKASPFASHFASAIQKKFLPKMWRPKCCCRRWLQLLMGQRLFLRMLLMLLLLLGENKSSSTLTLRLFQENEQLQQP
jgi:hypothetical protein